MGGADASIPGGGVISSAKDMQLVRVNSRSIAAVMNRVFWGFMFSGCN
jgi:hypothetical protein